MVKVKARGIIQDICPQIKDKIMILMAKRHLLQGKPLITEKEAVYQQTLEEIQTIYYPGSLQMKYRTPESSSLQENWQNSHLIQI